MDPFLDLTAAATLIQESIRKRPRMDGTNDATNTFHTVATGKVKDPEFWFEDGTVILVARDVVFLVYKGILAEHSQVFSEMFALPNPTAIPTSPGVSPSNSSREPLPVVNITDSPEDIRHILRALMPVKKSRFLSTRPDLPSFHLVSAYARLGHKYRIDDLVEQSLNYLTSFFTTSYDRWYAHAAFTPDGMDEIHAIGVVNIARLTGCTSVLPTALAVCCTLGADLVAGFCREDGTPEQLSMPDLALCFAAQGRLAQATTSCILRAFAPFSTHECDTRRACASGIQSVLHAHDDRVNPVADPHPFLFVDDFIERTGKHASICSRCLRRLKDRIIEEQRAVWNELPELVGVEVPEWPAG